MGSKSKARGSVLRLIAAGLMVLTAGACTEQHSTMDAGPVIQVKPDRVQVVSDALGERLRLMVAAAQPDMAPAAAALSGHVALLVPVTTQ
jgi:hypothetical protein